MRMNSRIFVDFDGTITDIWRRYYALVSDFFGLSDDLFLLYRNLKKTLPDDRKLLPCFIGMDSKQVEKYLDFKHQSIESKEYLSMDTLLIEPEILKSMLDRYNFNILTIRKNPDALYEQYRALGIEFLKSKTVVLKPEGSDSKLNWIKQNTEKSDQVIIVGDSETDLAAGTMELCKTFFVCTGLRSLEAMPGIVKPDYVCADIKDFFRCLAELTAL